MISLKEAVIVEGKYDKIRLSNIVDATIITTDGFRVFKDEEKCDLIRLFAERSGIIVITDSDSAGQQIRSHIKKIASKGKITNIYLPAIKGKEKRKSSPSSAGLLGVEGIDDEIIISALSSSGVSHESIATSRKLINKTDLFTLGLTGSDRSAEKRKSLCKFLNIPLLPTNTLIDAINTLYGYERFMELIDEWKQKETEN